jgi:4-hydroxyphenylpyruvate dioxygenase-like putative hemolysin
MNVYPQIGVTFMTGPAPSPSVGGDSSTSSSESLLYLQLAELYNTHQLSIMSITGIAHVNLTVPPGTLDQAAEFYGSTLGFTRVPVPVLQKETLAW